MQKKTLVLAMSAVMCGQAYAKDSETDKKDKIELDTVEVTSTKPTGRSVTQASATGTTKMDISLKDTPRSVVNLEQEQLDAISADDVGDVFDYVAGFHRNGTADRSFVARGVRTGISNVLVDGMRTLQGGEAGTGSRFPSTHNADSVSFMRGGDGILYGAGIGGGMINIETRKPQAEQETNLGVASRSYLSSDTGNLKRNGLTVNLDSTGKLSDDDSVLYLINAQLSPNRQMYQNGREETDNFFDATVEFNLGKTTISPKFEYGDQNRTGGSSYGDGLVSLDGRLDHVEGRGRYFGSPDDYGKNRYTQIGLRLEHEFNNHWKGFAAFRHNKTDSDTEDLYTTNSTSPVPNVPFVDSNGRTVIARKWVRASGRDTYKAFDANVEGEFQLGGVEHHFLAGVNYLDSEVLFSREFQSGSVIADAQNGTGGSPIDVRHPERYQIVGDKPVWNFNYRTTQEENLNAYVRDRMKVGSMTFIGGLGYVSKKGSYVDDTQSDSSTLYDLGAIYHISNDVNAFVNLSRTYEFVSTRYIAQYGSGRSYDPIEGYNYELGLKGDFFSDKLSAGVTLFNLTRENSTNFERVGGVWVLNQTAGKSAKSQGLEAELIIRPTKLWTTSLSYAYTNSESLYTNGTARKWGGTDYAPKHSLAVWNKYQWNDDWSADIGFHYDSTSYDYGSLQNSGDISIQNTFKTRFEVDTGVSYHQDNWSARLAIKNLFDQNRVTSGSSIQQLKTNAPRSMYLSFNYKF